MTQSLSQEIEVRSKAEQKLHITQNELFQAGKMAVLGQMSASITHELNQPLTALRSEVHQRIVFADSVAAGRLARETAPDSAAAREITALVDELLRWPT